MAKVYCTVCDCRRETANQEYCPVCTARYQGRQPPTKMITSERVREVERQVDSLFEKNIPAEWKYNRIHELSGVPLDEVGEKGVEFLVKATKEYSPTGQSWSGKVTYSNRIRTNSVPKPRPASAPSSSGWATPSTTSQGSQANPCPTPCASTPPTIPATPKNPKRGWTKNP